MGYFSQKDIEYQNHDLSCPDERMLLRVRLSDLMARYEEIRNDHEAERDDGYISGEVLKYVLPEHIKGKGNLLRAIDLVRYELFIRYQEFTCEPFGCDVGEIHYEGQMRMIFRGRTAAGIAA